MRKRKNKLTKQAFAVVVDGQTEYWYLQMLKQNEPNILFDITPKILQKKNIDQQYELITLGNGRGQNRMAEDTPTVTSCKG